MALLGERRRTSPTLRGNLVRTSSPPTPNFEVIPAPLTVKPGQSVLVGRTTVFVADARAKDKPFPDGVVDQFAIHVRPGMFRADFRGFVKEHPTLATGPVSFEVKAAETDGGTAWGTEAGGLQAGLGYKPGGKRVYSTVRRSRWSCGLRNVSEKEVAFSYLQPFVEHRAGRDGRRRQAGSSTRRHPGHRRAGRGRGPAAAGGRGRTLRTQANPPAG